MTSPTTPRRSRSLHWGYALVALTALLATGGVILWLGDDDPVPEIVNVPPELQPPARFPAPDGLANRPFHSMVLAEENGTQVVKFRLVEQGDEIVIDAATGRLIETRPYRPIAVPMPMGKLAAPFAPMM